MKRTGYVAGLALLLGVLAPAAVTTVSGTLYDSTGDLQNCSIYITPSQAWTTAENKRVEVRTIRMKVVNGAYSINLEANDTSNPSGTSYVISYVCQQAPTSRNATWVVPTSGSPVNIQTIETTGLIGTSSTVALSQLSGAIEDHTLIGSGAFWQAKPIPDCPAGALQYTAATNTLGCGSSGGAPTNATYITQMPDATLSAEQALSALATGILKNTTATGVLSIAIGTDLPAHNHAATDLTSGLIPIARGQEVWALVDLSDVTAKKGTSTVVQMQTGATATDDCAKFDVNGNLVSTGAACSSAALADPGSNGMLSRTALNTTVARTLTGTTNEIDVANGTGVSANPTFSLSAVLNLSTKTLRVPNSITLPATCAVGDSYMDTDAASGARWYLCEAVNTWVVQTGGAGGAHNILSATHDAVVGTAIRGDLFYRDATAWNRLPIGAAKKVVTSDGTDPVYQFPRARSHATDCTSLTDGNEGELCFEQDANTQYVCEPTAGLCDTPGEWTLVSGGSGATSLSGLDDLRMSSTTTVASTSPGKVRWNDTVTNFTGTRTITKTAGTDTGTFYTELRFNSGSPTLNCNYGTGITITNYTVVGYEGSTCTSLSGFSVGAIPLGQVDITSGTLSTTPTDQRTIPQKEVYTAGAGLTLSSYSFAINPAAYPNLTAIWDARGGTQTFPARDETSDPGTCTEGEEIYNTTTKLVRTCTATNVWNTTPNIPGALQLSGDISPAQITVDQNDYNPTGLSTATTLRLNSDAARNITGLAGGTDGRVVVIHNIGAFNIVLVDESVSSTAANRFALSSNLTLAADDSATLQYDSTSSRWRNASGAPGTGGGGSHNLLSATHSDTTAGTGVRGDVVARDATAWTRLALGTAKKVLTSDGTDVLYQFTRSRSHATDCTALTDGNEGEMCYEQDANTFYVCEPTAGLCDTAGEWIQVTGGGGGTPGGSGSEIQYRGGPSTFSAMAGSSVTTNGYTTLAPTASTSGSPTLWTFTGPAHTTLTLSAEATDLNFNLARTVQFATGALTTQRAVRIQAPTYAFVAASTLTTAATLEIGGSPAQGTNATITNAVGLWLAENPSATRHQLMLLGATPVSSPSANGTFVGANPATFTGDFINLQVGNNSRLLGRAGLWSVSDGGNTQIETGSDSGNGYVAWRQSGYKATWNYDSTATQFELHRGFYTAAQVLVMEATGELSIGRTACDPVTGVDLVARDCTATTGDTLVRFQGGAGESGNILEIANDGGTVNWSVTAAGLQTINLGTTPSQALLFTIAQPGVAGTRDSHFIDQRGTSFDSAGHNADWRRRVNVTSNAAASTMIWESRIDAASFATRASLTDAGLFDAATLTEGGNAVPNSTNHLGFFAATTSAQFAGVISDETGTGLVVLGTSPTLSGTPVIGDGAGNDKLEFAEEATNPTCAAGNYFVWANSADNKLKKCENGTISDLDLNTGGAGGVSNYPKTFSAATTVTVPNSEHGFGHDKILVACYDNSSPRKWIQPKSVSVHPTTFEVIITFDVAETGLCILNGSGGAGTVTGTGTSGIPAKWTSGTAIGDALNVPYWSTYTIGFASLTAAALTQDVALFTKAAKEKLCGITIKHTTAFAGTFTALTVSVGSPAQQPDFYASAFDIMQAVSTSAFQDTDLYKGGVEASEAANARFTSVGANLNTASAGSVDISVCRVIRP